jgi:hypothetical protein
MGNDSGFWTDLRDHAESIGILAAFVAIIFGTYRVWVPTPVIERNHERVTAMTHWVSQGTWLALMQSGVRWVLRLMEMLYGPPREGNSKFVTEYLTVRAWKMSAWIAASLLFVVPPLLAAFLIPIVEFLNGRQVPWTVLLASGGVALAFTIPFALTWHTTRRDDHFSNHHGVEDLGIAAKAIILEGTKIAIVPSLAILIGLPLIKLLTAIPTAVFTIMTIGFGGTLLAILTGLIRAIRRHGFLAPLAFVLTLMVVGVYSSQSLFLMVALLDGLSLTATPLLFLMPGWVLTLICFAEVTKEQIVKIFSGYYDADKDNIAVQFFWILAVTAITIFFNSNFNINVFFNKASELFVGITFIFITPFIISIYAAIYANSIPDWLSVALTRSTLIRASRTDNLLHFFRLLLLDLICVVGLCLLTAAILIIAFTFSAFMISFASDFSPNWEADEMANFFSGGIQLPLMLIELLIDGSTTLLSGATAASNGAFTIIMLATLSLTSIIPTLLNACIIIGLITARCFAMILMPPFKIIYGLLLVDNSNISSEKKIKFLRSSILIALIFAFFCFLFYSIIWFGSRWLF